MSRPVVVTLRALGLGDLLAGVPALRAVREAFPTHHHVLATPACFDPLVQHAGLADEVADTSGLRPLSRRLLRPDVAVDLHGRGPGSQPLLIALTPRRLVAFAHADLPATAGGPRWRAGEHEVHRWCRLLEESGIAADPDRLDIHPPPCPVPAGVEGATVIHPGAASGARRWPADRFAAVARAEHAAGRRVVITGTASEAGLAHRLADAAGVPDRLVLAGRTGILELLAVVAAAGRVVCGDTGVAHAATAVGTPSVVLFGPVSPAEWGPPAGRPQHRAIWTGGRGDPHGATVFSGLLDIGAPEVIAAVRSLPERRNLLPLPKEAS